MNNRLLIKAEYVVNHPLAGSLNVMDIFKPACYYMQARLEHAKATGEFYEIEIHDASGEHVSKSTQRIISISPSEFHNTIIVTTSDI